MVHAAAAADRLIRLDPCDPRILPIDGPAPGPVRLVVFLVLATLLFAIACSSYAHWAAFAAGIPFPTSLHLPANARPPEPDPNLLPVDPRLVFAGLQGSIFFWSLIALVVPMASRLWLGLRAAVEPEDARYGLLALAILLVFGFAPQPLHLGVFYTKISLVPFAQENWGLHRRILLPALAHFLHLDGVLFNLFQMGLVGLFLTLLRGVLRRAGCEPPLWAFVSLVTCSFAFHNFQFPGYPDIFILTLALVMVTVRLPPLGQATLVVLGLLTHEALAFAVLGPLLLWMPRRHWPLLAAPYVLYALAWAVSFGFDIGAGWHAQVDFDGQSGPELLLAHPGVELFGILMANKVLWLVVVIHLIVAWRRSPAGALRLTLPVAAAVGLCVPSYDTSRMAGMGAVTLVLAFAALWPRLRRGAGRWLLIANLALPSVYISPHNAPLFLCTAWLPGLYMLWPMAATGSWRPPEACLAHPLPPPEVGAATPPPRP